MSYSHIWINDSLCSGNNESCRVYNLPLYIERVTDKILFIRNSTKSSLMLKMPKWIWSSVTLTTNIAKYKIYANKYLFGKYQRTEKIVIIYLSIRFCVQTFDKLTYIFNRIILDPFRNAQNMIKRSGSSKQESCQNSKSCQKVQFSFRKLSKLALIKCA